MYLKHWIDVTRDALPSLRILIIHEISGILLVKCAAIEASSRDSDTPISAERNAPQSFAPSPHIQTVNFSSFNDSTRSVLCSGAILA